MGYHVVNGKRGILALIDIDKAIQERQVVLQGLRHDKYQLERKIVLLNEEEPDLDYVDELKRSQSGMARDNEYVIILQRKKR